jgi:hypothetical protein
VFLNSGNIVKMFTDTDETAKWLFAGDKPDR